MKIIYFIAEIGANHEGKLKKAYEHISAAKKAREVFLS
jgi:sialic acid synthase SpsE